MAKKIVLTYEGNDYTLEFNRKTVESMERNGFVVDTDKPYTMVTQLFAGAFQMHHKFMKRETIKEIWDAQNKKDELLAALIEMYSEPIASLMNDAEEAGENPTWKLV